MKPSLYFVGKAYPSANVLQTMKQAGYRLGLLHDKATALKHPEPFDRIIEMDFSQPNALVSQLPNDLQIDGLLCTYENYIVGKSVLARHFKLPAQNLDSAYKCTDKQLMRQAFIATNPAISPAFQAVNNVEEARAAGTALGYPLMLKPVSLVKSLLVLKCEDEAELVKNFFYAQTKITELYVKYHVYDRQPQLIVEQFLSGRNCSVAAFVDAAGVPHFCDGLVAITSASERGINDNYLYARQLPADFSSTLVDQALTVAREGVNALGMSSTPAHIELMYDHAADTVKIIEIGARIGGYRPRMYQLSYGINLLQAEIDLALGEQPNLAGQFQAYSAAFEIFPTKIGAFQAVSGLADSSIYEYFSIKPKVGQAVGPAKDGFKACAVVMVSATDKSEFQKLCQTVDRLRIEVA